MKIYTLIVTFILLVSCARHHGKNRFDILEFLPKKEVVTKEENVVAKSRPYEDKTESKGWLW